VKTPLTDIFIRQYRTIEVVKHSSFFIVVQGVVIVEAGGWSENIVNVLFVVASDINEFAKLALFIADIDAWHRCVMKLEFGNRFIVENPVPIF
jgi:hypothetical protein